MTFAPAFHDWQVGPQPDRHSCSPNLRLILDTMASKWPGLTNQGCFGVRTIRGGIAPSSHTYGAAIDVGFPVALLEQPVEAEVIPWLIAWSEELGIDAVHDYRRCRIWRAGRTNDENHACTLWWKAQRPSGVTGMGQTWANHLHLEVTPEAWSWDTALTERGIT